MPLLVVLVSGMVLIVLAADYFTNGIEWLGFLAKINEGATGSLLAAMGTALPETLVPVAAIYFGGAKPDEAIGLGAIFGAPLMLASLGFFVIGVGLGAVGKQHVAVSPKASSLQSDLRFFLLIFPIAMAVSWLPRGFHAWASLTLVGFYVFHARGVLLTKSPGTQEAAQPDHPLHLFPSRTAAKSSAGLQVAVALFGLILGAHFFVQGLDQLTTQLGWSPFLLAVLVTPVATELPEVFNSVIWLGRGRDALAVGNVSGALAFQSSVVPALGMILTRWRLTPPELGTAALAWAGALWILYGSRHGRVVRTHLLLAGFLYVIFLAGCFILLIHV